MTGPRLTPYSPRVAAARVRIKRQLRRAGVPVAWDAPTRDLVRLWRLLRGVRP